MIGTREQKWCAQKLGQKLYELRTERGMSQEQVAQAVGIATFSYRKLEHGESNPGSPGNPRFITLVSLIKEFGVSESDILAFIDEL